MHKHQDRPASSRQWLRRHDILNFITTLYEGDLHAKRVLSLANATQGVLTSASLAIHAVGRGLAQAMGTLTKHGVKQVDRLLSNRGVDVWAFFAYWTPFIVAARTEVVVALDSHAPAADGEGRQLKAGPRSMSHRTRWICPARGRPLNVVPTPDLGEAGAHRPLEISREIAAAHACVGAARFPQLHSASSSSIIRYQTDDEGVISEPECTLTKPSSGPTDRDHLSSEAARRYDVDRTRGTSGKCSACGFESLAVLDGRCALCRYVETAGS